MKPKNSLTLCMIVRDEADDLPRALQSVLGLVDEIVIVDTGSQDATLDIARSFGARIFTFAWQGDFSGPRNLALAQASGAWVLILDADEELQRTEHDKVRRLLGDNPVEGYLLQIVNFTGEAVGNQYELTMNLRLFRNRPQYRYSRRLHEQIAELKPGPQLVQRPDVCILHYGYLDTYLERKDKKNRNLSILLGQLRSGADAFDYFNLGVEYQRQNRYPEAIQAFRQAWSQKTGEPQWASACQRCLIQCLLQAGAWQDALQSAEQALEIYPDYADIIYLKGVILAGQGKYPQAIGAFYEAAAVQVPPQYAHDPSLSGYKAYYSIGQTYLLMGQREKAEESLYRSLELNPGYQPALTSLVRVLLDGQTGPAFPAALEDLFEGDYLKLAERCHEAELHLTALSCLACYPARLPSEYLFLRGVLYWKTGDYRRGLADLRQCCHNHPQAAESKLLVAGCEWLTGETSESICPYNPAECRFLLLFFLDEAERVCREAEQDFSASPVVAKQRARLALCRN